MRTLAFTLLFLTATVGAAMQDRSPELAPPYRFFTLVSHENLQEKLNQYGSVGYRFLGLSRAEGGASSIIMERVTGGPYEYTFASGNVVRSEFSESLQAVEARGFCVLKDVLTQQSSKGIFTAPIYSVLLEKSPDSARCEIRLFTALMRNNLFKDMTTARSQGFSVVAAMADESRPMVVLMQRKANASVVTADNGREEPFRIIKLGNMQEREQKLQATAMQGYRLLYAEYAPRHNQPPDFMALLEISQTKPEYKLLTNDLRLEKDEERFGAQVVEFEKQLNELAATGYRATVPKARLHFTGWAKPWRELSSIMVKSEVLYEYRMVTAEDTPALGRKLNELYAQGFRVMPMGLLGSEDAIVERPQKKTE